MTGGKTDPQDLKAGDSVTWKWGSQHPEGTVKDVVEGEAKTTTKRGKEITKEGDSDDPVVVLEAKSSGSGALKKASEVDGVAP
ncbi:Hva1_TUDOR domain-containing protein [Pseudozyma hubeiensis]|nr:Hva1_TUDOR domain-containing protein [Pseudozyma hubeiensis]KAJ9476295.1 Hva1_TUDOR domain-containing protein [Pseudozyma hubeiensis]KAJ9478948.1 Hva1_TUDOR domain-containing protein [Pseudozyma hubeiensis]